MSRYEISPQELKQKQESGESFMILDVREAFEYNTAKIEGATLIPLGELSARIGELDEKKEIVTLCHHGIRSQSALSILLKHGFSEVKNLTGGIDAYSCSVDSNIPRYR